MRATPRMLVIEHVHRDPEVATRVSADVRVGGHAVRAVFDFARPGLIEHVDVPWLLGLHPPSLGAVVSTVARIEAGETVALPVDLSDEVGDTDPPNPWRPLDAECQQALDAAADHVALEVHSVEWDHVAPERGTARLVVDGQLVTIDVEVYAEGDAVPVVRWLGGTDPAGLTTAQRYAIERALLA